MMKRCMIYFDEENFQNTIDLLEVARLIYEDQEYETVAISFQQDNEAAMGYFDRLVRVHDSRIHGYDMENITNCLEEIHRIYDFDSILIPANYFGRQLAPRLAMRLRTGLVADVTAIGHENGQVEMVRPAFSGKIMAGIVNQKCRTMMMSVRPNVFRYDPAPTKETIVDLFQPTTLRASKIRLLETREKAKAKDIRESKVLVSGGGGVMEHFGQLQLLADRLDGMVSASRRIVDAGMATRSIQVGQSGKTVSPKLYIALGVYGSLQHIEGLKNVDSIICVNVDRDAPICSLADIVVEGDAVEFIHKIVEKIDLENK